ncbi:hypothetical protein BC941DRAFT_417214 [Chlamydoabsidia padenii]|nr:hypothetical protein BC941DRAFT_417214 [Chlamydoabsidia padenii]
MSTNSRYRERKYNSADNDRLSRILSQPIQSWEKKWAPSARSKNHQIFKWVKSDRTIVFEDEGDDEDDDEDNDEENKDHIMTESTKETPHKSSQIETQATATRQENDPTQQTATAITTTPTGSEHPTNSQQQNTGLSTTTTQEHTAIISDNDEDRTHTPKLSDVPDVDTDQIMDDKESNTDDLNDASRHPAFAPHIHPQLTDEPMIQQPGEPTMVSIQPIDDSIDTTPSAANDTLPSAPIGTSHQQPTSEGLNDGAINIPNVTLLTNTSLDPPTNPIIQGDGNRTETEITPVDHNNGTQPTAQ